MKLTDLDLNAGMITVRGEVAKSRKSRMVPIQRETARLLEELIRENEDLVLSMFSSLITANRCKRIISATDYANTLIKRGLLSEFTHTFSVIQERRCFWRMAAISGICR